MLEVQTRFYFRCYTAPRPHIRISFFYSPLHVLNNSSTWRCRSPTKAEPCYPAWNPLLWRCAHCKPFSVFFFFFQTFLQTPLLHDCISTVSFIILVAQRIYVWSLCLYLSCVWNKMGLFSFSCLTEAQVHLRCRWW